MGGFQIIKETKMYKKLKKAICISTIIGIVGTNNIVSASSILDTVQATETEAKSSDDISYSLLRGNNLNYGEANITQLSSGEINITGATQCHRVCDEVYLELYLEQKSGNSYYTYKNWDYSTTDATRFSKSLNVLVPRGHYYRLRGYHAVIEGGTRESTTTCTQGIWVD